MKNELSLIEEQSIKAVRFAHRLLLTACFAAFIFSFSPTEMTVYRGAVGELNALLGADLRKLQLQGALKNDRFNQAYSHVQSLLSNYGLSLFTGGQSNNIFAIQPDPPRMDWVSLDEINQFITQLSQISVSITSVEGDFERDILDFLDRNKNQYTSWDKTISISTHEDSFSITFGRHSTGSKLSHRVSKEDFDIPFNFLSEIKRFPELRCLIAEVHGNYFFMPNLKQVWDQVRSENPIQARAILARKDVPNEKRLVVLGLSIPHQLISWLIPGIIFALSIFLLVHILHLQLLTAHNTSILKYPWIGVMPGKLAASISAVTVLLIPIIALMGIVRMTWNELAFFRKVLIFLMSSGTAFSLIFSFKKLRDIKILITQ
ncbi:MAG: hypothetical protein WAW23_09765 [Candidatus Methanoperedens sp.]